MIVKGFILGMLVSAIGFAAGRHDHREARQNARIRQGVKSGELTESEAAKVRQQQRKIHRTEERMEADGQVSAGEAAKLERMQDRASKTIYRKKHNERERSDAAPVEGN